MLAKKEFENCLRQPRRIGSNEPSPRRTRTSSVRPSARSRTTCQTVTRRGISSETMGMLYDGR